MKAKTYRIALTGLLGACAVALSYLESLLPTAAFLPPGAKPGFSNLANMFAASLLGSIACLRDRFAQSRLCRAHARRHGWAHEPMRRDLQHGNHAAAVQKRPQTGVCGHRGHKRRLPQSRAALRGGGAGRQPLRARVFAGAFVVRRGGGNAYGACLPCGAACASQGDCIVSQ